MLKQPENLKSLPSIRDTVKIYGLTPDKKLGQNFLYDSGVTDQIVLSVGDLNGKTILEIGPGPGGLTRSILASQAKKIFAIEMDSRCIIALKELERLSDNRLQVINTDALRLNEFELSNDKFYVIANLPYNIGTALIFKWLEKLELFSGFTLMLQKEVVDRICAKPSSHEYGKISIQVQIRADVEKVFDIDPSFFYPPPKVNSSVVRITPFVKPKFEFNEMRLNSLLHAAFGQRRKMIRTTLASAFPNLEDTLQKLNIDSKLRAEDLTPQQYCQLSLV